jgi:hypothetical protein
VSKTDGSGIYLAATVVHVRWLFLDMILQKRSIVWKYFHKKGQRVVKLVLTNNSSVDMEQHSHAQLAASTVDLNIFLRIDR